jgi:hypothetical protein
MKKQNKSSLIIPTTKDILYKLNRLISSLTRCTYREKENNDKNVVWEIVSDDKFLLRLSKNLALECTIDINQQTGYVNYIFRYTQEKFFQSFESFEDEMLELRDIFVLPYYPEPDPDDRPYYSGWTNKGFRTDD